MSNYPDDFRGFPQDAAPTSDERAEARLRGDTRCDLIALCEDIGGRLADLNLSENALGCFADALCEELYQHPHYRSIFVDFGQSSDSYKLAEMAMARGAAAKQEAAA
jgi:hypothetical protein